jgi:ribokinase
MPAKVGKMVCGCADAHLFEVKAALVEKLKAISPKDTGNFDLVVMPDFFFDHFVNAGSFQKFVGGMQEVYARKGGNLLGHHQAFAQGGNAGNMAVALSSLGFNVHFVGRTSELGKALIEKYLGSKGVDISHLKADGELATTVALEFENTNVMVSYSGSNADFGFDSLTERDITLIERCDLLTVSNWSQNKKGTDLAKGAFTHAKKYGAKTYFDTGDPTTRHADMQELIDSVHKKGLIDIYGLNENELQQFSGKKCCTNEELMAAADFLHKKLNTRLDFHTANFSYCADKGKGAKINTFKVKPYRMTGAGDSWNAGNAFGELFGFSTEERMMFANAFAGAYIASPKPVHPSIKKVVDFLNKTEFNTI